MGKIQNIVAKGAASKKETVMEIYENIMVRREVLKEIAWKTSKTLLL